MQGVLLICKKDRLVERDLVRTPRARRIKKRINSDLLSLLVLNSCLVEVQIIIPFNTSVVSIDDWKLNQYKYVHLRNGKNDSLAGYNMVETYLNHPHDFAQ